MNQYSKEWHNYIKMYETNHPRVCSICQSTYKIKIIQLKNTQEFDTNNIKWVCKYHYNKLNNKPNILKLFKKEIIKIRSLNIPSECFDYIKIKNKSLSIYDAVYTSHFKNENNLVLKNKNNNSKHLIKKIIIDKHGKFLYDQIVKIIKKDLRYRLLEQKGLYRRSFKKSLDIDKYKQFVNPNSSLYDK